MFHAKFVVYGDVQGVGYRSYVKRVALMENMHGYVRNMLDGTVEVVVETEDKAKLIEFRNKLNKRAIGSFDSINVERITEEITETKEKQFNSFELRF
jgi:acylphosphatase